MSIELRAFYPKPDVEVRYLDDEPELAAKYHADQHLSSALVQALRLMSHVWVMQGGIEAEWGWTKLEPLPSEQPGSLVAFLGRSRIYAMLPQHLHNHPHTFWCGLYGGNYKWLHSFATALYKQHSARGFKVPKVLEPVLKALDKVPTPLTKTTDKWCEPDFVGPVELMVESTVESYRRLTAAQATSLEWTPNYPKWMEATYAELIS